MEIEDFAEDDFYQEEIPENIFRNLIELEPNVYGEFQLPEDIWQEDDDIIIVEHNDIYNDPIYWSSDNDISDERQDGYEDQDGYEEVDGYVDQDHQFQNHYESEDSAYEEGGSTHNDDDSDISWNGEDSVYTFRDYSFYGWLSSEDEDRETEGAVGYAIDYDRISQQDEVLGGFYFGYTNLFTG